MHDLNGAHNHYSSTLWSESRAAFAEVCLCAAGLSWVVGDAEELPFDDDQFDIYTIAFGIRNVTHIDQVTARLHHHWGCSRAQRLLWRLFIHVPMSPHETARITNNSPCKSTHLKTHHKHNSPCESTLLKRHIQNESRCKSQTLDIF